MRRCSKRGARHGQKFNRRATEAKLTIRATAIELLTSACLGMALADDDVQYLATLKKYRPGAFRRATNQALRAVKRPGSDHHQYA